MRGPAEARQRGKRKLTQSAREFPKAFRLAEPAVSAEPGGAESSARPDHLSFCRLVLQNIQIGYSLRQGKETCVRPARVSNAPLCSELSATRSPAGCSKWHPSKAAGSSATEAYPWGTLQGDGRLRTTPGKRRVSARRGWAGEKGGHFQHPASAMEAAPL